jgi:putative hemolysin
VLIDGGAPLDEVKERFGLDLPEEDYDTLGGFILGELGHVPKPGDTVQVEGADLVVRTVDERRVRYVLLVKRDDDVDANGEAHPGEGE